MAVEFSPANVAHVNKVVQRDFKDLDDFILGLQNGMPLQRPNSKEVIPILDKVILAFQTVATAYYEKAKALLGDTDGHPRLQKYEQVLGNLENHALKLSELIRPDPDKAFFPNNRRQKLHKLIGFVAGRANVSGSPFILPVLGDTYKYVNVNYIKNFGLICLPPRVVTTDASDRNLSVLWHETAGYAIARAKDNEQFEIAVTKLHTELQKTSIYWQRYALDF